jgi:hypothetical protein
VLEVGLNQVHSPDELWRQVDRAPSEGRRFGLFMLLPKTRPVAIAQFRGPNWIALRVAADERDFSGGAATAAILASALRRSL